MNALTKIIFDFIVFTVKCCLAFALIVFVFVGITIYQNSTIKVTEYSIKNKKLPKSFNNFKIVQLSDIHNDYDGDKLNDLTNKVKKEEPNIIVITGDLVDAQRYNVPNTLNFIDAIKDIAPIYFIYGNHDIGIEGDSYYTRMVEDLEARGVTFLNIKNNTIAIGNDSINIVGIQDPSVVHAIERLAVLETQEEKTRKMIEEVLNGIDDKNNFTLMLAHRPEYFKIYTDYNIDLVLTGHAHGGQFRMPLIGGLYAPNQGLLPKYTSGVHRNNNTEMIISRGLGNSRFPIRIFNTPEIVSITLKSK